LIKKCITQILTRLKSKGRYKHFSVLKNYEYKTRHECKNLQKKLLFNMLKYSIKNIPYYRNIAKESKIVPSKRTVIEDLKKFPILTKQILREEYKNLKSERVHTNFIKNTSGGSTGEPVLFLQDVSMKETGIASQILFDEWAGRKVGEKMIKLWGCEKELLEGTQGFDGFINKNLLNITLLNSFRMTKKDMLNFTKTINREKPKMIEAYVQSIYELAKFIKENKLKIFSPNGVITSAGTLYPEVKKFIEEVFNCPVFNRYGSREVGSIACSCEKGYGLHLNIFNHYIEILDNDLKPCKPGKIGKVYVTTLHNFVMPLIRYDIGDMAVAAKIEQCSCGRGLPLIEKVVGRTVNLFKTKTSELIDGEYFTHLFYFKGWVKKFQITQKDYNLIQILVVLQNEKNQEDIQEIEHNIKIVMGKNCKIVWKFVNNIKSTKSGKYLYTISEVK